MKIKFLNHIFIYIKTLINWLLNKVKKIGGWVIQDPRNILSIINILLLIYALKLSIQNRNDSSRFQESVVQNLSKFTQLSDSLKNNLNALPKSIESFGTSINGLNYIIEKQQDSLNKSIGSLNENVNEFSKSLLSYKDNLSKIVEATDKQIELLKKTQARWEEEISRKPELYLHTDSIRLISSDTLFVHFSLWNIGDQTAKVSSLVLNIPTNCKFISDNWMLSASDNLFTQYSYSPSQPLILTYSSKGTVSQGLFNKYFRFRLIKPINSKFPLSISYVINEEKTGSQTGELKLPVSELNAR